MTGSSVKLICPQETHFFQDGETFHAQQFQILRKIKETGANYKGRTGRPFYFEIAPERFPASGGQMEAYEMDLNKAYVTAARTLNVFPRGLLSKVQRQPKDFRLKLLGSLATRKYITDYDKGGDVIGQREIFCKGGVALWRRICETVGILLKETARRDRGFLFFWVDNYFTTERTAARILRAGGYRVKIARCNVAYVMDDHGSRVVVDGCRPFFIPRHNSYTATRITALSKQGQKIIDNYNASVAVSESRL